MSVYYKMPVDEINDYDKLKLALLNWFQMTEVAFRDRFRESKPVEGESFPQYLSRLDGYLERWVELANAKKTYEGLRDLLVGDQALGTCTKELRLYVREKQPGNLQEMGEVAQMYLSIHGCSFNFSKNRAPSVPKSGGRPPPSFNKGPANQQVRQARPSKDTRPPKICYLCGKPGHFARECPITSKKVSSQTTALGCEGVTGRHLTLKSGITLPLEWDSKGEYILTTDGQKYVTSALALEQERHMPIELGMVEGIAKPVKVLRDTGCSGAVIRKDLCVDIDFTGTFRSCQMMDGRVIQAPMVSKEVSTPFYSGKINAIALESPVYDLVIGNIDGARPADHPDPAWSPVNLDQSTLDVDIGAVTTRAQTKVRPPKPLKVAKSRVLGIQREELQQMQEKDQTLQRIQQWITDGKGTNPRGMDERFYRENGLVMRERVLTGERKGTAETQLVLPHELRDGVLEVAHDAILGGHLGCQKTLDRVQSNFYWPGMQADVTRYCQSCDICQRTTAKGHLGKAPLGTVPIIDIPFSRVAIDLIGPLPASERGHKYILTLVDYATRYPEAVPLKRIEAEVVAEALIDMFSRIGIPREILSDRGTQFTSSVMGEVARLLSLKQLFTIPYHAMCNGLVEKFNGTLKQMLKRMCAERPRDWDRYIAALLFAYREVPQESLKFSPFEMVYGHVVRGPLAVLRELWTGEIHSEEEKSTFQYVLELRERLEETCQLAHEELVKARASQRKHFNKKARQRDLKVGDDALILLPTDSNKLMMQWKGPYHVFEKVGENGFKIDIAGKRKTFHINMLKKYVARTPVIPKDVVCCGSLHIEIIQGAVAQDTTDDCYLQEELIQCPLEAKETFQDVVISKELTTEQQEQAIGLFQRYADVCTDLPGKTDLAECTFELTSAESFRAKAYPIPFALQEEVKSEVDKMLKMGIIEPSVSEYSSPPVVVRKADGSCRYCIDMRALNALTVFDAEPMPNQEVIIAQLGTSRYLTKMDLSKGYWQVPIRETDRRLTAFPTERGLMQFKYMPFGCVNSGAIFCRMMRRLLEDQENVVSYVDDLVMYNNDWEDHLQTIQDVLDRLRKHGLTAKPSKCEVGCSKVKLLGHYVGDGMLWPQQEKVNRIREVPRPRTKKQIRSFLGLVGYYRKFIQDFATVARPLTDMTKKAEPTNLKWDEESEAAFEILRKAVSEYPVLRLPLFDQPFILCTDASKDGIGAVLM